MSEAPGVEINEALAKIGVQIFTIPAPTGEDLHRLQGWRDGIEREGQELWRIYHWIVSVQQGSASGVYRLREWLEQFNVPDLTGGAHWRDLTDAGDVSPPPSSSGRVAPGAGETQA